MHNTHHAFQEFFRWPETTRAAKRAFGLRYKYLPALSDAFLGTLLHGTPVIRPLVRVHWKRSLYPQTTLPTTTQWYEYWDEPLARDTVEQFLYAGSKLMVVTVLRQNASQASAVFPKGHVWHPLGDSRDHPVVDARAATVVTNVSIPLEDVAVYIKGACRHGAKRTRVERGHHTGGDSVAMHVGDGLTVGALQEGPLGVLAALPVDLQHEVPEQGAAWNASGA